MDAKQRKRIEILEYASTHGWVINPGKGMEIYVDNIIRFGHCPCDSSRPDCPCSLAEEEVASKGRCRCSLYWTNYEAYKETLRAGKGEEDAPFTER